MEQRKVAVVGAGVAGLTAAYVLSSAREVTLYEADGRLGGHAHTRELAGPGGRSVSVDSGFIVHNERTYPTLLRLFDELGVATQDTEMSMSVRCDGCALEYAGARGPAGLFASRAALRGRYLRLLAEVPAFHRAARRLLAREGDEGVTFGDFLRDNGFSPTSSPTSRSRWCRRCGPAGPHRPRPPAAYLFTFLDHHGLLSVTGSPRWRTVTGGSAAYVAAAAKRVQRVLTASPVAAVRRTGGGAVVTTGTAPPRRTTPSSSPPTPTRRCGCSPTRPRRTAGARRLHVLPQPHRAAHRRLRPAPLPARPGVLELPPDRVRPSTDPVRISYDMRRLQRLPAGAEYVVTLGGDDLVAPDRVVERMVYEHPVYTPASVAAQRELPGLNTGVTAYAGAWHGWGFHEDGCRSGVLAALSLGVRW